MPGPAASVPDLVKLSQLFKLGEPCREARGAEKKVAKPWKWKYLGMRKRNGYGVSGEFSHFREFSVWREEIWIMNKNGIRNFHGTTPGRALCFLPENIDNFNLHE